MAVKDKADLTKALKEFEAVQMKYMKFGAWDTEPTGVLYELLDDVEWNGEATKKVPTTIRGWQLFSDMKGAGEAARELAKAARKVVREAKKAAR